MKLDFFSKLNIIETVVHLYKADLKKKLVYTRNENDVVSIPCSGPVSIRTQSLERSTLKSTQSHIGKTFFSLRFPVSVFQSADPKENRLKVKREVCK